MIVQITIIFDPNMDLIRACEIGYDSLVKDILDTNVDPNYQCKNHVKYFDGTTALHLAVANQNLKIMKLLLDAGATAYEQILICEIVGTIVR
jgi:ankyrin repeat protein